MPEDVNIRKIEQGRAEAAYDFVSEAKDNKAGNYKSNVKKMPILIKTNGLGQSLAFIKGRNGWDEIYKQLDQWLQEKGMVSNGSEDYELVGEVIKKNSEEYRQIMLECIALLNWMRRFVDSLIGDEDVREDPA